MMVVEEKFIKCMVLQQQQGERCHAQICSFPIGSPYLAD